MFAELPLLSLVIWVPVLGGMLVLLAGSERGALEARVLSLLVALATFGLSLPLWGR